MDGRGEDHGDKISGLTVSVLVLQSLCTVGLLPFDAGRSGGVSDMEAGILLSWGVKLRLRKRQ